MNQYTHTLWESMDPTLSARISISYYSLTPMNSPRILSELQIRVGDLDVLILCSAPIQPMTLVRCYPIGVMTMEDSGMGDEKIIAIPYSDPTYMSYTSVDELPKHIFQELKHFFSCAVWVPPGCCARAADSLAICPCSCNSCCANVPFCRLAR